MAQGSLLPHEDTRSQLGKFNFTKPLMFHKVLESKSSAATEKRVTRPLCRTWRRHPVGSSGPRFTPPPPPRCPPAAEDESAARTGLIHRRNLSSGAEHGAARRRGRTRGTHRDIRDPRLPARPAARSFITAAADAAPPLPPATPAASQASRDLYLAALQHISSISAPPSQQPTPGEPGLSDLKSRKDHHGMFSHHVTAFSIQPSPPTNRARDGGGASDEATRAGSN